MRSTVSFAGNDKLKRLFSRLPTEIADKVLASAVSAAALPIKRATVAEAPRDEGDLKRSIDRKVLRYKRQGLAIAIVGPRSERIARGAGYVNPARYANPVNFRDNFMERGFASGLPRAERQMERTLERGIDRATR
jgi:Arc/MetJ family transcription regulator